MRCKFRGRTISHTEIPKCKAYPDGHQFDVHECQAFKICTDRDEKLKLLNSDVLAGVCDGCQKFESVLSGGDYPISIFDRVVVLNLERRADRLVNFQREVARDWPFRPPAIVKAIDGTRCPAPEGFGQGDSTWGCFQSHRLIVEQAINDGCDSLLVFEDDALLCDGFSQKAKAFFESLPDDWELIWLGGWEKAPPVKLGNGILRVNGIGSTVCYGARGSGLMALYKHWHKWHDAHCDWAVEHWVAKHKTYAPAEWLVEQAGGWSDIRWRSQAPENVIKRTGDRIIGGKVGDKLKEIITDECGIAQCQIKCKEWQEKMNLWGVSGCEEHRQEIIEYLSEQSVGGSWTVNLLNAVRVGTKGYFSVDSMLNTAIRRARNELAAN